MTILGHSWTIEGLQNHCNKSIRRVLGVFFLFSALRRAVSERFIIV